MKECQSIVISLSFMECLEVFPQVDWCNFFVHYHFLPLRSCFICCLNLPPKTAQYQADGQLSAVDYTTYTFFKMSLEFLITYILK